MINTVQKHNTEDGNWSNTYIITYTDSEKVQAPHDLANRHYQEILEWAKIDGNTIEDAD